MSAVSRVPFSGWAYHSPSVDQIVSGIWSGVRGRSTRVRTLMSREDAPTRTSMEPPVEAQPTPALPGDPGGDRGSTPEAV